MSAYRGTAAHLRACLERLDCHLRLFLVEWWAENATERGEFGGLYVSDEAVVDLLDRTGGGEWRRNDQLREEMQAVETDLERRAAAALDAGTDLRLLTLADRFGLSDLERDALVLALAPELDPKYEKLYGYLQDDVTASRPTVGLVCRVLSPADRDSLDALSLFSPSGTLRSDDLVSLDPPGAERPRVARSVVPDRRVVEFLLGSDDLGSVLAPVASVERPDTDGGHLTVEDRISERLDGLAAAATERLAVHYISGPAGVGRDRAAARIARETDCPRLRVRASAVPDGEREAVLGHLIREATLRGAAIQVDRVDAFVDGDGGTGSRPTLETLVERFDDFEGQVFLTGTAAWQPGVSLANHELVTLSLPRQTHAQRVEIWERHAPDLPADVTPTELAAAFTLTEGQIADAVAAAATVNADAGVTAAAVYQGCRAQSRSRLDELVSKIDPAYGWDDIVLAPDERAHLMEVAAHVRNFGTVYEEWGFEAAFSRGNGLTALFAGPSGTGKTMAAEVVANAVGLDLYKIDLSSVVSKYIGETEQNLSEIFAEAEHSNSILLFDEADAIFGERSEVSDAQDRYANVEVNYLLQRIEEYDGIVLLTTNYEQNIDDAFHRRIDATITFTRPDEDARRAIWAGIFPEAVPVDELDVDFLATFDVTGGNVRNVAKLAAFLAAEDGTPVGMGHLVSALRREFQKTGKLLNPDEFEPYQDLLDG